jgi:SCY1-like protein 1
MSSFFLVLAMLVPLFYIMENYQDPSKIGNELGPLVSKLFTVPDRGVRSILLNQVNFMTQHLDKAALNVKVFEPLCSGFNDSSPVLRELTLKATLALVPSLNSPNIEKLSRYLVRLQGDTETSIRTNAVIFIAKISPHLSSVSREKMLLPAYARAMKDPFAPCRLSALQSTLKSKELFSILDLATKVLPSVTPLTLDPVVDVRREAFQVVHNILKDLQQESTRMEQQAQAQMQQQQPAQPLSGGSVTTPAAPAVAQAPVSGGSGGYISSLSSWMSSSTQPTTTTDAAPTTAPAAPSAPQRVNFRTSSAPVAPLVKQMAATSLSTNSAVSAPVADDGWGDDDDDDGWGDDDDVQDDPFSKIGVKPSKTPAPSSFSTPSTSASSFTNSDDPFASLGMKTSSVGRTGGGKLVLPKKATLGAKKLMTPPATKLQVSKDEDVEDGWDDF